MSALFVSSSPVTRAGAGQGSWPWPWLRGGGWGGAESQDAEASSGKGRLGDKRKRMLAQWRREAGPVRRVQRTSDGSDRNQPAPGPEVSY